MRGKRVVMMAATAATAFLSISGHGDDRGGGGGQRNGGSHSDRIAFGHERDENETDVNNNFFTAD